MNGYAVVSSVRLCGPVYSRPMPRLIESPQPYSWPSVNCLPRRLSIVLRTRTIKFKADPFWGIRLHEGGSFHTFRLIRPNQSEYAILKRGPHYMGE